MCYLRGSRIQQRGDERERKRAITRKTVEEQAAAIALIHCGTLFYNDSLHKEHCLRRDSAARSSTYLTSIDLVFTTLSLSPLKLAYCEYAEVKRSFLEAVHHQLCGNSALEGRPAPAWE